MLETDIFVIVVMCLVLIGMFVCITLIIEKGKKEEKAERMKKALAYQNELKQRQKDFDEKMESLKNQYGDITIYIKLSNGDFKKILAYTLADNQQSIYTTTGTTNTETSTGSMAGRALVGGVLLGGAGAMVGAVTANKDTKINTTTSQTTTHDYIIYLSIDDMINPQRILKFGTDAESANKAAGVFNIIINRNNQQS